MATTKGTAIAAPQIFQSDPLEQGFAKQMFADPSLGGSAFALMMGASADRGRQQESYMTNLQQSNRMAAMLAQQEMQSEIDKEALKQLAPLANAGIQAADVPAAGRMYTDPRSASAMEPAGLQRAETRAKIAKLNAEAQAKFGESAPKITTEIVTDSNGQGQAQLTIKGGDPRLHPTLRDWWLNTDKANRAPGAPGARPGSATTPGAVLPRHPNVAQ